MNFILSAEAACDFTPELAAQYNVSVMPMKYMVDGTEYRSDDGKMPMSEICAKMKSGSKTSTSQPNLVETEEYLTELLKQGKDILHLSFSSAQSGTCANFKQVAEKLNAENKNKIYVVDTLCQCSGVGLLIAMVSDEINAKNLTVEQARDYAESVKLNIDHYFTVDTFTYLARGGRIPSYLAAIGNIIKIKPVMHLDNAGKIIPIRKFIGRKRALDDLIRKFSESYNGLSKRIFIGEADCLADAEYVRGEMLKAYPDTEIVINPLGPIIVSHSGPGTLALFFTVDERKA